MMQMVPWQELVSQCKTLLLHRKRDLTPPETWSSLSLRRRMVCLLRVSLVFFIPTQDGAGGRAARNHSTNPTTFRCCR